MLVCFYKVKLSPPRDQMVCKQVSPSTACNNPSSLPNKASPYADRRIYFLIFLLSRITL